MSCSTELPLIITTNLNSIPKIIRLKNLPISPKYRARMSNSHFDESADSISELNCAEFPVLTTPPLSPAKPNISPRKTKEIKNMEAKIFKLPTY